MRERALRYSEQHSILRIFGAIFPFSISGLEFAVAISICTFYIAYPPPQVYFQSTASICTHRKTSTRALQ